MKKVLAAFALLTLAAPAQAASYPVSGKWGQSTSAEKGAIDCANLHVIDFQGGRRFDNKGGVRDFRAIDVRPQGGSVWRVTEEFTTGQIGSARNNLTLRQVDSDHVEMALSGGTFKLRRCK